jgi:hypothetical protein
VKPWHVVLASIGRHALFPSESRLRRAVRALARVAGDSLVSFCLVDEHVHLVVLASRPAAGRLARAVALALRPHATGRTAPAYIRPVENRRHLETLVPYVLRQSERHGLPGHPALWTGSSFLDLSGARVLPGLRLRLRNVLPRWPLRRILAAVAIPSETLGPPSFGDIRDAGLESLVTRAAAAVAAPGGLDSTERLVVEARVAVVRLALDAGFPRPDVAAALRAHARTVRRLAGRAVDERVLLAVRRRIALERLVEGAQSSPASAASTTRTASCE